ncbi:hypothetical protein SLS60_007388 [Paraconiothyrium brasiliense]|uniref:Uncharacterized protein n=1 Tax=Paraconiothyrium brasiliense TaxID=300254 RepID=A0ABR3R579_9PLEO
MSHRRLPINSQAFKIIAQKADGLSADVRDSLQGDVKDEDSNSVQPQRKDSTDSDEEESDAEAETQDESEDEDEELLPSDTDLSRSKQVWKAVWKKDRHCGLARSVMTHEIKGRYASSITMKQSDNEWAEAVMTDILFASEDELIESVAFGNLARDRRQNQRLNLILRHLNLQAQFMPSIYHQQLVDKRGESPSCSQFLQALPIARNYIFGTDHADAKRMDTDYGCYVDDDMANELDCTRHDIDITLSRQSFRKFLWTQSFVDTKAKSKAAKRPKPSSGTGRCQEIFTPARGSNGTRMKHQKLSDPRVKQAIWFCDELEKRLEAIDVGDRDKPLAHPLVEVGYSERSIERLKKHAAHESSNYLMNMFQAILEVLAKKDKKFSKVFLEQHVIYLIWHVEQAEISEIGWTKLAEGYTSNAGGFSHYPAGQSNYSAQKVPAQEWSYACTVLLSAAAEADRDAVTRKRELMAQNLAQIVKGNMQEREALLKEIAESKLEEFRSMQQDTYSPEQLESLAQEAEEKEQEVRLWIYKDNQARLDIVKEAIQHSQENTKLITTFLKLRSVVDALQTSSDDNNSDEPWLRFPLDLSQALDQSTPDASIVEGVSRPEPPTQRQLFTPPSTQPTLVSSSRTPPQQATRDESPDTNKP